MVRAGRTTRGKHTGLTGRGCAGWKWGVETSSSAGRGQEHVTPCVSQHLTLNTLITQPPAQTKGEDTQGGQRRAEFPDTRSFSGALTHCWEVLRAAIVPQLLHRKSHLAPRHVSEPVSSDP